MKTKLQEVAENTVKTSISIDRDLFSISKEIARQAGYRYSFSRYINDLLRADASCRLQRKPALA
jgi:hypothetical protein